MGPALVNQHGPILLHNTLLHLQDGTAKVHKLEMRDFTFPSTWIPFKDKKPGSLPKPNLKLNSMISWFQTLFYQRGVSDFVN